MIATSFKTGTLGSIALLAALSLLFLGSSAAKATDDSDSILYEMSVSNQCDGLQDNDLEFAPTPFSSQLGSVNSGDGTGDYILLNITDKTVCGVSSTTGRVTFTQDGFGTDIIETFTCIGPGLDDEIVASVGVYSCGDGASSPDQIQMDVSVGEQVPTATYQNRLTFTLIPNE
jgi:hypothetical protein